MSDLKHPHPGLRDVEFISPAEAFLRYPPSDEFTDEMLSGLLLEGAAGAHEGTVSARLFAEAARHILAARVALRECGEKLAQRDAKIIELRDIIHADDTRRREESTEVRAGRRRRPK